MTKERGDELEIFLKGMINMIDHRIGEERFYLDEHDADMLRKVLDHVVHSHQQKRN